MNLKQWLLKPSAKVLLFMVCLIPFGMLLAGAVTDHLGADPAQFILLNTGIWALRFLCIALCITPLRQLTGWSVLARFRRMLGLFVFFYASLHLLSYAGFDMGFDVLEIVRDIPKRPFILVGFLAWTGLLLMALTSINKIIKKMGARRWKKLHQIVYSILLLGLLHFFWMRSAKHRYDEVELYAVFTFILLGWRVFDHFRAPVRAKA